MMYLNVSMMHSNTLLMGWGGLTDKKVSHPQSDIQLSLAKWPSYNRDKSAPKMYEFLSTVGTLIWLSSEHYVMQSIGTCYFYWVTAMLTRPLHVPYLFGLPYSYTIPSGTRPTSI